MAVGSSIIIKIHKKGGYVPPVMHLWVDLRLWLVTRMVTSNKWNDIWLVYYSPLYCYIQNLKCTFQTSIILKHVGCLNYETPCNIIQVEAEVSDLNAKFSYSDTEFPQYVHILIGSV